MVLFLLLITADGAKCDFLDELCSISDLLQCITHSSTGTSINSACVALKSAPMMESKHLKFLQFLHLMETSLISQSVSIKLSWMLIISDAQVSCSL
jgi:hypothetical protein